MNMHFILRTDGGARGNPGPAGIGVVIENAETGEVLEQHAKYLGKTTNNQAEYRAVLLGLERCRDLGAKRVDVLADSELLIKQANGQYKVKNADLAPLFLRMKNLCVQIGDVAFQHVRREKNKMADALANRAMDEGMEIG